MMKIKKFIFYKTFYLYPDDVPHCYVLRLEPEKEKEIAKNKLQIKVVVEPDPWTEDELKYLFEHVRTGSIVKEINDNLPNIFPK